MGSQAEVARQAKSFQPSQPIPKPICDRSGQLDITQDVCFKGETSRSQEIRVKSFHEELCSSDRSRQLDRTSNVIMSKHVHLKKTRMSELSKPMIDQGNLINTSLQYKMTLKYIMRPKRSTPTIRQFVEELRETETSKFQDYQILL